MQSVQRTAGNRALELALSPAPLGLYRQRHYRQPVRFPTLEVYAIRSGGMFATAGRGLSAGERGEATAIFGPSIQLDQVRIVESTLAAAPTTLGNYIRVPPHYTLTRGVLIHELTHVWQYQTKGTAYVSDSLWHQTVGAVFSGSRHAAGIVTVEPGKSIHAYTAEQQAVILTWYATDPSLASHPDFIRILDEVSRATPLSASFILNEAAYGPGMGTAERVRHPPGAIGETEGLAPGGGIPLIRWEF